MNRNETLEYEWFKKFDDNELLWLGELLRILGKRNLS